MDFITDTREELAIMYWNIENYSYCWQEKGEIIKSPEFKVISTGNIAWNILLYPRGYADERFITFFLSASLNEVWGGIDAIYEFAILAEDGSSLHTEEKERIHLEEWMHEVWSYEASVEREEVTKTKKEVFLSQDTLRIRCRLWRNDGIPARTTTFFARTALSVKKWNFLWDIEEFSSPEPIYASDYGMDTTPTESNSEELIFDIGVNEDGYIEIGIEYFDKTVRFLKFQSFIIDTNGSRIDCGKSEVWPHKWVEEDISTLPFSKKDLIDNKDLYLKDDVLVLHCECSWSNGFALKGVIERIDFAIFSPGIGSKITTKLYSPGAVVRELDKMSYIKDSKCLHAKGIFSDVKLCTTSKRFYAHKAILSDRSSVFREMFLAETGEKSQKRVDVLDLEDDTLRRLLLYMYTDHAKSLHWESALKLYTAAEKYKIEGLKRQCCAFIKRNICPSKVCDALNLAEIHKDHDVKEAALICLFQHPEDVFRSRAWKRYRKARFTSKMETASEFQ